MDDKGTEVILEPETGRWQIEMACGMWTTAVTMARAGFGDAAAGLSESERRVMLVERLYAGDLAQRCYRRRSPGSAEHDSRMLTLRRKAEAWLNPELLPIVIHLSVSFHHLHKERVAGLQRSESRSRLTNDGQITPAPFWCVCQFCRAENSRTAAMSSASRMEEVAFSLRACHERTFGLPLGKLKVSRMVGTSGREPFGEARRRS